MQSSSIKLLIVDDSPEDRETIRSLLLKTRDNRYCVSEAHTASEGAQIIPNRRPDCVLLDYWLPDVDGLRLLQEYSKQQPGARCPIVLMTGDFHTRFSGDSLRLGAQDFLAKKEMTPEIFGAGDSACHESFPADART